jgi:hypothetical protein
MFQPRKPSAGENKTKYIKRRLFIFGKISLLYRILCEE